MTLPAFRLPGSDDYTSFVEELLQQPATPAFVSGPPGSGKTHATIQLAAELRARRAIDSVLVITDYQVLRDQWSELAGQRGLHLAYAFDQFSNGFHGIATTVHALRIESAALIEALARGSWLIVVDSVATTADETLIGQPMDRRLIDAVINVFIRANKASRALFVSSTPLCDLPPQPEPYSDDRRLIEELSGPPRETPLYIQPFSPSLLLLHRIHRDATVIDGLHWREFEKLIAMLLERDRYEITLSRGTKDGGVDILAVKDMGVAGEFRSLWQAKRTASGNKVGLAVVRELADVRQELGANKAIVVTSTYLTRGACKRIDRERWLLGKVDRDGLEAWIARTLFRPAD